MCVYFCYLYMLLRPFSATVLHVGWIHLSKQKYGWVPGEITFTSQKNCKNTVTFLYMYQLAHFFGPWLKSGQNITLVTSSHSSGDNFLVASKVVAIFSCAEISRSRNRRSHWLRAGACYYHVIWRSDCRRQPPLALIYTFWIIIWGTHVHVIFA